MMDVMSWIFIRPMSNSEILSRILVFHLVCWFLSETTAIPTRDTGSADEARLFQYLFEKQEYNPNIRPTTNISQKTTVELGLAFVQLIYVDEKNQIMKSNVWLRERWNDHQLQWDRADYDVETIRVAHDRVWLPDIVLFNNADGKYEVSHEPNVVINYTGDVLWIPPTIYKSSCAIDVEFFPFDEQSCSMVFGSWTYNKDEVDLEFYDYARETQANEMVNLENYRDSGTWDIITAPGYANYSYDVKENRYVAQMTFTVKLRRKTLFYTVNLLIPCVLISFLSVCVFYLPSDAAEKMTMGISILLALVVFLLLVSKILPPSSKTLPLIAKYLLFAFIMDIISLLVTVVVINWNFRTSRTHRMPRLVKLIFLEYLPRLLHMSQPDHGLDAAEARLPPLDNFTECLHHHPNCRYARLGARATRGEDEEQLMNGHNLQMTDDVHKVVGAIRFIAAHLKNEDDYNEIVDDWHYIAMVLDRLLLYIFLGVTLGGAIGILLTAPNIFEFLDPQKINKFAPRE